MTNAEILGNKLFELRKRTNLSQEEFADKIGVSRQAVSKWERGEALPDTDNLITIAKLHGVSLDELISHTPTNPLRDSEDNELNSQEGLLCDSTTNNEDTIFYKSKLLDEHDRTKDEVNVKIDLSPLDIKIVKDFDELDQDIKEEEEYYSYDNKPSDKKRRFLRFLSNLPYPILVTVVYLFWGCLAKDGTGWQIGWTLFITVPVYYTVIDCFKHKRLSDFCYPVFIAFIYCFMGMAWKLWHPYWILFITIPIFYAIAEAIDKK